MEMLSLKYQILIQKERSKKVTGVVVRLCAGFMRHIWFMVVFYTIQQQAKQPLDISYIWIRKC